MSIILSPFCRSPRPLLKYLGEMKQESASRDFDQLQAKIQRRFDALSPHLKRIAEYALAEPNRFALQTVARTAGEIGVQPSTLVRFAKIFEYSGFSALQRVFRIRLTEATDNFHDQVREHRNALQDADGSDMTTILNSLSEASVLAIDQLKREMTAGKLLQAVQMLEQARYIQVLGQRQAFPVAACISLGLLKLGRSCQLLDSTAGMLPNHIANLTPDDLLVVIGLTDFSRAVLETVPEAHQRGVPVLAISNSHTDPLACNSSLNLMVRDSEVHQFEPLAPYIVLAQTMVVSLASRLEAKAELAGASDAQPV